MTGQIFRLLGCVALAASLSACASEKSFQDIMGAGKSIPDASNVPTNQALTMPPDLQLRPPGSAPTPSAQPAVPQAAGVTEPSATYQARAPGQPLSIEPSQQTAATAPPPVAAPAPAPATVAAVQPPAAAPGAAPAAQGDVYARYGISTVNPDGTPKTQAQLREELRQKQIELKRAQNPSYGTIFNMGSIWSD
ncbi:MAG: hypothetical protein U1E46_19015 [Hyphomicrobiales bacterium]